MFKLIYIILSGKTGEYIGNTEQECLDWWVEKLATGFYGKSSHWILKKNATPEEIVRATMEESEIDPISGEQIIKIFLPDEFTVEINPYEIPEEELNAKDMLAEGITDSTKLDAIWDFIADGDDTDLEDLKSKIVVIKDKNKKIK